MKKEKKKQIRVRITQGYIIETKKLTYFKAIEKRKGLVREGWDLDTFLAFCKNQKLWFLIQQETKWAIEEVVVIKV